MSACGRELTKNVIIIVHLPHCSSFGKRHESRGEIFGFGLVKSERENSCESIPWNACQRQTLVRAQWVRLTVTPHTLAHTRSHTHSSDCRLMPFWGLPLVLHFLPRWSDARLSHFSTQAPQVFQRDRVTSSLQRQTASCDVRADL